MCPAACNVKLIFGHKSYFFLFSDWQSIYTLFIYCDKKCFPHKTRDVYFEMEYIAWDIVVYFSRFGISKVLCHYITDIYLPSRLIKFFNIAFAH